MRAPDLTQPLIGYRAFGRQGNQLYSPVRLEVWEPGVKQAKCRLSLLHPPEAPVPASKCRCGLYAYHELGEAAYEFPGSEYLLAAVKIWGRCEVHHLGIRSQYAQVVLIALPTFALPAVLLSYPLLAALLGHFLFKASDTGYMPNHLILLTLGLGSLGYLSFKGLKSYLQIRKLAKSYGAGLASYFGLKFRARRYGTGVPDSLRPEMETRPSVKDWH